MNATTVHPSPLSFSTTSARHSFHFSNALKSLMKKVYAVWLACYNQVLRAAHFVCNKVKHPFARPTNQGPKPAIGTVPKAPLMAPAAVQAPAPAVQKTKLPKAVRFAPPPASRKLPAGAPHQPAVVAQAVLPASPKLPRVTPLQPAPQAAVVAQAVFPASPKQAILQPTPRADGEDKQSTFAQICSQALREAEGKIVNSVVTFDSCYISLYRQITQAAQNLHMVEEPTCILQRYKTLASYLCVAAERANSEELRYKVAVLFENLLQKYANHLLAIPADHETIFEQIRSRIAIRKPTDPVSLPLPGDEPPEDEANVRSVRVRTWLDAMFSKQNYRNGRFYLGNHDYDLVTSEVSDFTGRRLASIGSSQTREIITLDPNHCPKLSAYYQQLEQEVIRRSAEKGGPLTPEAMLLLVKDCVRNKIFPSCGQAGLVGKLDQFVAEKRLTQPSVTLATGGSVPVFSIEDFVGGPAVCRHHGLVSSYLLDRLVKSQGGKTVPTGRVMHMRSNLDNRGAHVWVAFICSNGKKYHLDTLWNNMMQFDHPATRPLLDEWYGQNAMRLQELRCNKAARQFQSPAVPQRPAAIAAA